MKMTPQQERVLSYIKKYGSIEPLIALRDLGVYRLSDVIFKLRTEHNIDIKTKRTNALNRYNEKCSFATYVLEVQNETE